MLGMVIMIFRILACSSSSCASSSESLFASALTCSFIAMASSFLPWPISLPISLEILFLLARRSSASFCAVLLCASSSITSSTSGSFSSWNFFRIFSFTTSGFSLKNFKSIIFSKLLFLFYNTKAFRPCAKTHGTKGCILFRVATHIAGTLCLSFSMLKNKSSSDLSNVRYRVRTL